MFVRLLVSVPTSELGVRGALSLVRTIVYRYFNPGAISGGITSLIRLMHNGK
jgi:hypothetical protein